MTKRNQKIISISIGIVLSILILFIGFQLMSRRGANAAPNDLTCKRDKSTGVVGWTDGSSDLGVVVYGTSDSAALPFLAQEESSPASVGLGLYRHRVTIGPLPPGTQYTVAVDGFTTDSVECVGDDGSDTILLDNDEGFSETVTDEDTSGGTAEEAEGRDNTQTPGNTAVEDTNASDGSSDADAQGGEYQSLPLVEATDYFNDNPNSGINDCVVNFKSETDSNGNKYKGLASTCSAAWTAVNLSN